jgi:thymidylate synthase (FAD)
MDVEVIALTPNAEEVIEECGRTAYLSFDKQTSHPIFKLRFISSTSNEESASVERPLLHQLLWENSEHRDILVDSGVVSAKVSWVIADLEALLGKQLAHDGRVYEIVAAYRDSAEKFIRMVIKRGHESVLEHASATVRVRGGSRAFTHQFVRHRLASITQQSQRYVNEDSFRYVTPPAIKERPEALELFTAHMDATRDLYIRLQDMGLKNEDARFVLPNATCSEITFTTNLREWRHIFKLRGEKHAQWEIRSMALDLLEAFHILVPSVFCDMVVDRERGVIVHKPL